VFFIGDIAAQRTSPAGGFLWKLTRGAVKIK
jgi:hypothetical protein